MIRQIWDVLVLVLVLWPLQAETKVSCLDDVVRVVESSAEVNHAQLVATQDDDILVRTYNRSQFFEQHFRKSALSGITSLHHFRFDVTSPGVVHVRFASDQQERATKMLHDPLWRPTTGDFPDILLPTGLSLECQWLSVWEDKEVFLSWCYKM